MTDQAVPFYHAPIMAGEVLSLLEPSRGGVFVDGTLGGGGHAQRVLEALPAGGHLYGIDRDWEAIRAASLRLAPFGERFTALHGNFFEMKALLQAEGVTRVNGILLDLGVSWITRSGAFPISRRRRWICVWIKVLPFLPVKW